MFKIFTLIIVLGLEGPTVSYLDFYGKLAEENCKLAMYQLNAKGTFDGKWRSLNCIKREVPRHD